MLLALTKICLSQATGQAEILTTDVAYHLWKTCLPWWYFYKVYTKCKLGANSKKIACPDKTLLVLGHWASWNFDHWCHVAFMACRYHRGQLYWWHGDISHVAWPWTRHDLRTLVHTGCPQWWFHVTSSRVMTYMYREVTYFITVTHATDNPLKL